MPRIAHGEVPADRPISPPDLAFTLLKLLGVDPNRELRTPSGRPIKMMSEGNFKELAIARTVRAEEQRG